jgi:hypothetical protein
MIAFIIMVVILSVVGAGCNEFLGEPIMKEIMKGKKLDGHEWLGLIFFWFYFGICTLAYVGCALFIVWGVIQWILTNL